ncbi:hypothetical protein BKA83DRAFT_4120841 [Pisolithus microcarpus]|nr:hypothetical protein BKA83DRAFT_4120841 [Pisolithus microcarpus]
MSIDKGKGKALPAESQAIEWEWTTQGDVNEDGESEVVEPDIQMDEETSEPWSSRRDGEPKGEGMSVPSDPPMMPKPKYGQAQVAARTTPPPDPHACRTCINCKCKIGCGKGNVQCASTARTPKTPAKCQATPTPSNSPQPRMPIPPQADGDTIPLSEVEGSSSSAPQQQVKTLRASMHGTHPAQNTAPPPIEADLFDLFGPSTNNTATVEDKESITTQLQGLVFMATPSSQEMATSGRQDPSLAVPVEVDSSSMQVGSGSGVASTGNEEQGGTVVFVDKH